MRKILFLLLFLPIFASAQMVAEYNFIAVIASPGAGAYGMNGFFLDSDGRGFTTTDVVADVTYFFDANGQKFVVKSKSGSSPFSLGVDAVGHANSPVTGLGQLTALTSNGIPSYSGGVSSKVQASVNLAAQDTIDQQLGGGLPTGYSFQNTTPDTSLYWIDQTTYDSTGVFEVKDYYNSWETVAWYDSVGNVFSNQPPIYAVVTGQSNATPRNTGGDNTPSKYTSWWDSGVGAWRNINLPASWTNASGNQWFGIHFGRAAAEMDGRIVKIVYNARGGRPISGWLDPNIDWTQLVDRIDSSHIQRIDVLMWYQGEADFDRTISAYETDFNTVYSQFKALPEWTDQTQFLVAQLNCTDGTDFQNGFLNTLAVDDSELTKVVHNTDTDAVDAQHISVVGAVQLGRRMYLTYSGRQDFKPLPQGYSVNRDTMWDFSNTHMVAEDNDTIIAAINLYDGWNGNIRINDTDSSGVSFLFPVVAYAHDGKEIISGIYGRFSSSAFIERDTMYLSKLPPYYVSNNTPFNPLSLDSLLVSWYRSDTLVYQTGGKVDSIGNASPNNNRPLMQPNASNRPDTLGQINGLNSISFTPTAWLEIDTTGGKGTGLDTIGTTLFGGLRDIYIVIKTTDTKGALFTGNDSGRYAIWDELSSSGANTINASDGVYVDGVKVTNKRDSLYAAISRRDINIIQLRQVQSSLVNEYLRIMDYIDNLAGFGTTGEFCELIISGSQFSQVEESKVYNYLRNKWVLSKDDLIVYSDVGKTKFNNPYNSGNTLDATISSIKASIDALPLSSGVTSNRIPKFNGTNYVNSSITDDGFKVGITSRLEVPSGSATVPALSNSGDDNTGVFFPAADELAIGTGGVEALRIDSNQDCIILGTVWLNSGKTLGILTGTGVPAITVDNGSTFHRTDGTGPNFYVRENGAWVAK